MGRAESKTATVAQEKKAEEKSSKNIAQSADDQAAVVKAMMQAMETLTLTLTEKVTAAIADLKSSLPRTQDPVMGYNEGFGRPEKATRPEYHQGQSADLSYDRQSYGYGFGQGPSSVKIQLERYSGTGTKTLPANWMKSYEAMASLQHWSEQYKTTMLRFYLADEAVTWFDNQMSHGTGTMPWYELKERFEKYFSQDKIVTPKMVVSKEWDPKTSTFYEHYKEMLRLFEISSLQDSWRVKVLKTSLPPYYARMCSGVETTDADEWYQRSANIISSLPKFEAKPTMRPPVKAVAAMQDIKTLARKSPVDVHDRTDDPSKCLFCCQLNPNHKLEDCFCHPKKLKAAIGRRNINVLEEADRVDDEATDVLTESDLEDSDELIEMNAITAAPSTMGLLTSKDSISVLTGVSNKARMVINNIITIDGLIDSGASVSAISEKLCSDWNISFRPMKKDLASVHGSFSTKGVAFVEVQIGPYQSQVKVYVLEAPPYPFILGLKEFKKFGIAWTYPYLLKGEADETVAQLQVTREAKDSGSRENAPSD